MPENKTLHSRNEEIVTQFFDFVELHLQNLLNGKETEMFHIKEIAEKLFVSYGHLTNTVKLVTKHPPCYHYDYKIITLEDFERSYSISFYPRFALEFNPRNHRI